MKLNELYKRACEQVDRVGGRSIRPLPLAFESVNIEFASGDGAVRDTGLYIFGDVGTGKTTTLYAEYYRMLIQKPLAEVWFGSWYDFVYVCENSSNPAVELQNKECLFFDDIGLGYETAKQLSVFYEIVNHRWEWKKLMLFTSNLSLKELVERYNEDPTKFALWHRIISRINDRCGMLQIVGNDKRLNKKQ